MTGFAVDAQPLSNIVKEAFDRVEQFQLQNKPEKAIQTLDKAISAATAPEDLACLYAYQSGLYLSMDSLLLGKKLLDRSIENAGRTKSRVSRAITLRASAYFNNILNRLDSVVKDALSGLKLLEGNQEELVTKYHLNYLLYGAYSKWEDEEKMEKYIRNCQYYAVKAGNVDLQANVCNGLSSMFLARYRKLHQQRLTDSSFHYLITAFELQQKFPGKVSGNTFVINCINLANYFLEFSVADISTRKQKAFQYLAFAEDYLNNNTASAEKWINVYGIKSSFAKAEGDLPLAEQYLLQGLGRLAGANGRFFKLEYTVNKELADIAVKENDLKAAMIYQQQAEALLKKSFNEQQLFNAQKLEVQYETEKKDQQLKLLNVQAEFRRKQNYLYGGIALALLFGLVSLFISYHFRLKYSIEREKKLAREKADAEQQAQMQLRIEKGEQARLKVEQELLDLRRQQLEKEALANSLIIERKNDTLKQIQGKIESGEARHIQKLIKEEMLVQSDFEDIRIQIQELHPDFFNQLNRRALQKLTPLDLKYCTYIYLKMDTKQIAQALHVEPQSVRMFKYRLKQKFGLGKDADFEDFLAGIEKTD